MLANTDKLAKPAKGRLFGLSVAEILTLVRQAGFAHSEFQERINVALVNPEHESHYGVPVGSFCPGEFLALFSFPDSLSPVRAKSLSIAVVHEFSILDRNFTPQRDRRKTLSFRAYLGKLNQLIITERHRTVTPGKYRGTAKFSNAFKPKAVRVDEKITREIQLG